MPNIKKNNLIKAPIITLVVLLVLALLPVTALATSNTQDGLTVELTTDKANYETGDTVAGTIKMINTNSFAVKNIQVELTLPSGLKLKSGESSVIIASLTAKEVKTFSFTATATDVTLQQTGDPTNTFLWVGLCLLSAGGLVTLLVFRYKKKAVSKTLSSFLCLTLALTIMVPAIPALAATTQKSFSVSETVKVNGVSKTITAKITYDWDEAVSVTGVTLNHDTLSLTVGDTAQLTATVVPANADNKSVTWSSSDTAIVTVSNTGLVTAKAVGNATITVTTADGGKTAICDITISPIPTYSITLTNSGNGTATASVNGAPATSAKQGDTVTITATPADADFVWWEVISGDVTLSSTTTNPATFTMPAEAVEIKAQFHDYMITSNLADDEVIGGDGAAFMVSISGAAYPGLYLRVYDETNDAVISERTIEAGTGGTYITLDVEHNWTSTARTIMLQFSKDGLVWDTINYGTQPNVSSYGIMSDLTNEDPIAGAGYTYTVTVRGGAYPGLYLRVYDETNDEVLFSETVNYGSGETTAILIVVQNWTGAERTIMLQFSEDNSTWETINYGTQPNAYSVTSNLSESILPTGATYTVTVKGVYPELRLRAYDVANNMQLGGGSTLVQAGNIEQSVQFAVPANTTNIPRVVLLEYSRDGGATWVTINLGVQNGTGSP